MPEMRVRRLRGAASVGRCIATEALRGSAHQTARLSPAAHGHALGRSVRTRKLRPRHSSRRDLLMVKSNGKSRNAHGSDSGIGHLRRKNRERFVMDYFGGGCEWRVLLAAVALGLSACDGGNDGTSKEDDT